MAIPLYYRKEEAHIRMLFPQLSDRQVRKESLRLKKQYQEYLDQEEEMNSESKNISKPSEI